MQILFFHGLMLNRRIHRHCGDTSFCERRQGGFRASFLTPSFRNERSSFI